MTQGEITIVNNHQVMMILEKFSLDDAGEVKVSLYDWVDGKAVEKEYRFSNIKKMIAELKENNIKCVNGKVTDQDGKPVWVDNAKKLEGKTLKEVREGIDAKMLDGKPASFYQHSSNQHSSNQHSSNQIKLLVNTEQTAFPERWMIGVTQENEILHWGRNTGGYFIKGLSEDIYGTHTIPQPKEKIGVDIKDLYATSSSFFVLYEDGDLYALGLNNFGQLGIGNTANQYKLIKTLGSVEKVSMSSVGHHQDYTFVMALKRDGSVWLTGHNGSGQLGLGNTSTRNSWGKANIPELAKDILAVGNNNGSSYILTVDGDVYSAGYNGYGQLGHGNTSNSSTFKKLNNITNHTVVKMVGAGGTRHSSSSYPYNSVMFLTDEGRVFSLGYNGLGGLGVGNTSNQSTIKEVQYQHNNVQDPVKDIFTSKGGWGSSGYITESGKLYTMGDNQYGQLGIGNTSNKSTPNFVMGDVDYVQAIAGSSYSYYTSFIAKKTDGSLWAWGYNGLGQIGDNSTSNRVFPVEIEIGNRSGVKQISQGGYAESSFVNVLMQDKSVYGWGSNSYQQVETSNSSNTIQRPLKVL